MHRRKSYEIELGETTPSDRQQEGSLEERQDNPPVESTVFIEQQTGEQTPSDPPPPPYEEPSSGTSKSAMGNTCLYAGLIFLGITVLLIVILVPLGFSGLDYYEMGFEKSKTTGKVDDTKVYFGGLHFVGVTTTFKKFKADAHVEDFYKIVIFNEEKLKITMSFSIEYFLYPKELPMLHSAYDIHYRSVLRKTVLSAVKARAARFTVVQYRSNRELVAKELEVAASVSLGGVCCRKNCTSRASCTKEERGLFADVRYFQLGHVGITPEQEYRFLKQVIETEKKDTVEFKQKETLTRKETERVKRIIENEAEIISQNATATANLITAKANANSKAIVEDARNSGLQIMFEALNITELKHKKSFDYLRTLRDLPNANLYVGFTTIVAKP